MPSKESWSGRKTNRATVHKPKQEGRQQGLLIAALGMKLGSQKSSVTIWQPLKLFAYSQLTSLVRRATLKENEQIPKYEKVHNFKVRMLVSDPFPIRSTQYLEGVVLKAHLPKPLKNCMIWLQWYCYSRKAMSKSQFYLRKRWIMLITIQPHFSQML